MTIAEYGIASAQTGAENPAYLWRAHGKIPIGAKFPHRLNSHSLSDFGLPQQMLNREVRSFSFSLFFLASAGFIRLDSNWSKKKPKSKTISKREIWKKYLFHIMLRAETITNVVWYPNVFFTIWSIVYFPISCRLIEVLEPILD